MALNELANKLDTITKDEFGFEFDEAAMWNRLEQRLSNRRAFAYWWAVAACLLAGMLFMPMTLLRESSESLQAENEIVSGVEPKEQINVAAFAEEEVNVEEFPKTQLLTLERRGVESVFATDMPNKTLQLEPIKIKKEHKTKSAFAANDISVIQASLEKPKSEKGRTITIRAQWQSSPDELNVNYQALKIKLNEKDK